jgi:hypothetical protein
VNEGTWTLSGFGDEIDADPAIQLAVPEALGARHIEVRSAWEVNIVDMPAEQVDAAHRLGARHVRIFSFYRGEGVAVESIRGAVLARMRTFADLAPHLAIQHGLGGFSGTGAFGRAARAFASLTDSIGVQLV